MARLTGLQWVSQIKLKFNISVDWKMMFGRGFLTWHRRPRTLEHWPTPPVVEPKYDYSNVAIVMQGVLDTREKFSFETLKMYRSFFPGVKLIVSTWTDADKNAIDEIASLGVEVLAHEPMIDPPRGNFSRQLETTNRGIEAARLYGADFVLKVRADQRLYSPLSIPYLLATLKLFPALLNDGCARGRIVFPSSNTFVDRILGATDFMQFGFLDDVEKLWLSAAQLDFPADLTPEQTITASYLSALGWDRDGLFTEATWTKAMREVLAFVDGSSLDFFWHKYSMREYLWRRYESPPLHEMTQAYWFSIMNYTRSSLEAD